MRKSIGDLIREAREAMGWEQPDLAERSGVTLSWVKQIETGRIKKPGFDPVNRVAKVLMLDLNKLENGGSPNSATTKALQIGTDVLNRLYGKEVVVIDVVASENCHRVIGTMPFPIMEGTRMLADHILRLVVVQGNDCHPHASDGDALMVAEDLVPRDGDLIVFEGKDGRCHEGAYHIHEGKEVVLPGHNLGKLPVDKSKIGTVLWKIQVVRQDEGLWDPTA